MFELIYLYTEKFNDVVPLQQLRGYSDNEIIDMIKEAIITNEPIKVK